MSLDPKAKEWSFLSRSSYINLSQINLQMAEGHVLGRIMEFRLLRKIGWSKTEH